jgi:hypothetical protein
MNENRYPEASTPLATAAMLYLSGEMAPAEAGAFEMRLALDQEAREALAEAVYLLTPLANGQMPQLDPGYRQRVRERWNAQRKRRTHERFAPLFWTLTGAVAASILWFAFLPQMHGAPVSSPNSAENKAAGAPVPAPMETVFADISNLDNLAKHHQQHVQHKQKQDDFMNHHRANQTRPIPPSGGGAAL